MEKRWIQLKNRRLQAHPSELLQGHTLVKAPLPAFLLGSIAQRFTDFDVFKDSTHGRPNHVLINEYMPGQGISPHEDGAVYYPLVATVSIGAHCVYNLLSKDGTRRVVARLVIEPGSCLITRGDIYTEYLHGIDSVEVDEELCAHNITNWNMLEDDHRKSSLTRGTRVSLTYRDVISEKTLMKFGSR